MLIESYVVEFKEIKKCLESMRTDDFFLVSENIFSLSETVKTTEHDLLFEHTPANHPEVMLLVSKEYAKSLILNDDSFEFLKKSHDINNLSGVTLHLTFANADLISELRQLSKKKTIDGISVHHISHEALLMAKQAIDKKYKDNLILLNKSIEIYTD